MLGTLDHQRFLPENRIWAGAYTCRCEVVRVELCTLVLVCGRLAPPVQRCPILGMHCGVTVWLPTFCIA